MMHAVSSALGGMNASLARFDASAARVATNRPDVDVTSELVDQTVSKNAFEANAKVLQSASDIERFMIQLWA